ncbi:hypothetical protein [Streptomyces chattanoogensis]|uniref:hypothetical protein n=1 Tax=Streptomyces chattanoogensis TaxID=66876 RepID=UPI0006B54CD7|nr:hypothetical protein [Streptomyces chattanoogensis]
MFSTVFGHLASVVVEEVVVEDDPEESHPRGPGHARPPSEDLAVDMSMRLGACQMIWSAKGLTVFRVARGIAVGAALAAALTACGGNSGAGSGSNGSGGSTGSGAGAGAKAGGEQSKAPVVLTSDQVRRALVDTESAPQGWEGFGVDMDEPVVSLKTCQADTGTKCGGFVALGSSHITQGGDGQVVFTLYAFRTPNDAKAAMKGLAAKEHRSAGAGAKPLKVSADTDETEAFTGRNTEIFMRLGGTLVRVASKGLPEGEPYDDFARLQVDRIKQTVEGKDVGG